MSPMALVPESWFLAVFLIFLFMHYIADFVMQTEWQAKNKSKSLKALLSHVGTYGLVFGFFSFVVIGLHWYMLAFIALNLVLHFCIDYVTSKMSAKRWAEGKIHDFFEVIGFDQWLHQASIGISLILLKYWAIGV